MASGFELIFAGIIFTWISSAALWSVQNGAIETVLKTRKPPPEKEQWQVVIGLGAMNATAIILIAYNAHSSCKS